MPKHYAPIAGVNAEEFIGELPGWLFSTVKYINPSATALFRNKPQQLSRK